MKLNFLSGLICPEQMVRTAHFHFRKQKFTCALDWVEIDISEVLLRMSARVSSRVFVGLPLCRDPDWIQLSKDITVNVFATVM